MAWHLFIIYYSGTWAGWLPAFIKTPAFPHFCLVSCLCMSPSLLSSLTPNLNLNLLLLPPPPHLIHPSSSHPSPYPPPHLPPSLDLFMHMFLILHIVHARARSPLHCHHPYLPPAVPLIYLGGGTCPLPPAHPRDPYPTAFSHLTCHHHLPLSPFCWVILPWTSFPTSLSLSVFSPLTCVSSSSSTMGRLGYR